ncbi:OmpA family protein [Photobacterium leiognathi]|uniref:OmpA family protein n=1 Tax=Photobacterium leiognathi TaxID=553611 RepID=UPI002980FFF0|nr:OmpA family protein [Photobacterium leiognathi]
MTIRKIAILVCILLSSDTFACIENLEDDVECIGSSQTIKHTVKDFIIESPQAVIGTIYSLGFALNDNSKTKIFGVNRNLNKEMTIKEIESKLLSGWLEHRVYFKTNSYKLRKDDIDDLSNFFSTLLDSKIPFEVELIGHADSRGDADHNLSLGYNRADSVRNILIQSGISDKDIEVFSDGDRFKSTFIDTEEYFFDRKVDIYIKHKEINQ